MGQKAPALTGSEDTQAEGRSLPREVKQLTCSSIPSTTPLPCKGQQEPLIGQLQAHRPHGQGQGNRTGVKELREQRGPDAPLANQGDGPQSPRGPAPHTAMRPSGLIANDDH